jgi:hypothetical protein
MLAGAPPRASDAEETDMITLAKGSVAVAGVLAAAAASIVMATHGHAAAASGTGGTATAAVKAAAHGGRHHHHHGHGVTPWSGQSGSGGTGSGTTAGSGGTGSSGTSGGSQPGDPKGGKRGASSHPTAPPSGPVNHGTLKPFLPIHDPAFWQLPTVTSLPAPSGTIGDANVPCLMGYVWRQAYSGDYVCVTPDQRTQAAADNAAATSRIQSGGGAYGQYTCQQGYVWRQVVSDDYVCVTPAERAQAAADNAQANNRALLMSLWLSDWTPPQQGSQQNCSNGVCTITEGGWDGPNFQINGDHFNYGQVMLQVRNAGGAVLWSGTATAGSYPGYPGGAFGAQTDIGDCSQVPHTTTNDYAIAYDVTSGRWSNEVPLDSDCVSL